MLGIHINLRCIRLWVKTKLPYNQSQKLSRESHKCDSHNKYQPGINAQMVVETGVMLWISVEVTTAQKVDEVAKHPQKCRQTKHQQILQTDINNTTISAKQCVLTNPIYVWLLTLPKPYKTRKPCYRKDDCTMRSIYKLLTLILFTRTATILCTDFDSERI